MDAHDSLYQAVHLDRYFFDVPAECPYDLPYRATYRQGYFGPLPDMLMEEFLGCGFRRNGNTIYTMACKECTSCIPIKLTPTVFTPNRSQKRVWKKNNDVTVEFGPVQVTEEYLKLCERFFAFRYPGRGNSPRDYYSGFFLNTLTNTFEINYRLGSKLLGVAIIDLCGRSLNAVYFYFDPAESNRSPGTFNILTLINFCKENDLDDLYLGYWVNEVRAMRYKANFNPHEILVNGKWTSRNRY